MCIICTTHLIDLIQLHGPNIIVHGYIDRWSKYGYILGEGEGGVNMQQIIFITCPVVTIALG